MALNCEEKLTAAIQRDCDNKPKGGMEVNVIVYNYDDLDKANTTFSGSNDLIITNLATKSSTTGYLLDGIKQVNMLLSSLLKTKRDSINTDIHFLALSLHQVQLIRNVWMKWQAVGVM